MLIGTLQEELKKREEENEAEELRAVERLVNIIENLENPESTLINSRIFNMFIFSELFTNVR